MGHLAIPTHFRELLGEREAARLLTQARLSLKPILDVRRHLLLNLDEQVDRSTDMNRRFQALGIDWRVGAYPPSRSCKSPCGTCAVLSEDRCRRGFPRLPEPAPRGGRRDLSRLDDRCLAGRRSRPRGPSMGPPVPRCGGVVADVFVCDAEQRPAVPRGITCTHSSPWMNGHSNA